MRKIAAAVTLILAATPAAAVDCQTIAAGLATYNMAHSCRALGYTLTFQGHLVREEALRMVKSDSNPSACMDAGQAMSMSALAELEGIDISQFIVRALQANGKPTASVCAAAATIIERGGADLINRPAARRR